MSQNGRQLRRIAAVLHSDEVEATAFCTKVRKLCKGFSPSYREIADTLSMYPEHKFNLEKFVDRIPRKRILEKPPTEPASPKDESDPYPGRKDQNEWLRGDWTTD